VRRQDRLPPDCGIDDTRTCRAMADDLDSRLMIHSEHGQRMQAAGARLVRALPVGNPLLRALRSAGSSRDKPKTGVRRVHHRILIVRDRCRSGALAAIRRCMTVWTVDRAEGGAPTGS